VLEARDVNVYLIGQIAEAWHSEWQDSLPCVNCNTLENAVTASREAAVAGETILLSPGCASLDQFENFEARGNAFKQLVNDRDQKPLHQRMVGSFEEI